MWSQRVWLRGLRCRASASSSVIAGGSLLCSFFDLESMKLSGSDLSEAISLCRLSCFYAVFPKVPVCLWLPLSSPASADIHTSASIHGSVFKNYSAALGTCDSHLCKRTCAKGCVSFFTQHFCDGELQTHRCGERILANAHELLTEHQVLLSHGQFSLTCVFNHFSLQCRT